MLEKTLDPQELTNDLRRMWKYYFGGRVTVSGDDTLKILDFLEFVSGQDGLRTLKMIEREARTVEFWDGEGQFTVVRLFDLEEKGI